MFYAGIGSRETTSDILDVMVKIGRAMPPKKYILRSGGADGADAAFETGCDEVNGPKEIFLPWRGFNGNKSLLFECPDEAFIIAAKYHPAWDKLKDSVKRLMARNVLQVLGSDLKTPVDFVVCWTKDGRMTGGLRTL